MISSATRWRRAADLDNVSLLRFLHLSEDEVEQRLSSGELAQSEVDGYVDYPTDHTDTCMKLSQLSFFGTTINLADGIRREHRSDVPVAVREGHDGRAWARGRWCSCKPTATSVNTRVDAPTGCGLLDFSADLSVADAAADARRRRRGSSTGATSRSDGQGNRSSSRASTA